MSSEVGSGQIAFVPTFKGFRSATSKEVDGATDAAGRSFKTGFGRAAAATGTSSGKSFKDSFSSASSGLVKSATDEVAKASRELSAVRLKEADVTGRVRLAESQLAEARSKYADGSSQVIRAEERLATASRQLITAQDSVKASTDRLSAAKRTLATSSVEAATSSSGFSGILSRLPQFFNSAGGQSARSFASGFSSNVSTLTSAAGSFLGISAAGLALGFGALIGTGISTAFDSVGGASDLFETTSAVSQVYGDAAADIKSFASTANKSLGQTRLQALKGAQTFGVFAKQAGLTGKPLANFSTGLVSLAGDLASFYNSSPDEAIEAIGAGLRGEAEPLRRFGVLLDDATLRQKALELGIYDGSDALTGQQRILAAQAVIMDQTTIAQGDFARTSDGLANQQRILAATLEDTKTKFGEALLPAFSGAATFANDTLLPKLDAVIDRVGPKLGQALEDAGPQFEELWKKAEPLIDGFADYAATDGIQSFIDVMNDAADAAPGWAAFTDFLFDPNAQPAAGLNAVEDWVETAGSSLRDFFAGSGREERLKWQDDFFAGFAADASKSGQTFGYTFGDAYTFGLGESKPAAAGAGTSLAAAANEAALAGVPTFSGTGGQLGSGFAAGILGSKQEVVDATRLVGDAAVDALRVALKISSPSRVTEKLGSYTGQGFTRGVIGEYGAVQRAMSGMVALDGLASSASPSSINGASPGASGSERAIYADGSLFGWIRELANGEAQLVVAGYDKAASQTASRGVRGWE